MKVSVICASDRADRIPCLYWSLVAQTHTDWELLILDQTKNGTLLTYEPFPSDDRVHIHFVPNWGDWGQTVKEEAVAYSRGDALIFPADDAYYVPTALAQLAYGIESGADVSMCAWLYDKVGYQAMPPSIEQGHVDVGGFMVRRDAFRAVGWRDKGQTGDYELLKDLLKAGATVASTPAILYVKN